MRKARGLQYRQASGSLMAATPSPLLGPDVVIPLHLPDRPLG